MTATPEKLRLFRGVNELSYNKCSYEQNSDMIINRADFTIESNSNVSIGSVIDFKKNDGSTTIFSAKVENIKTPDLWKIMALTNGFELNNILIEQVYEDKSPEYIVSNIIGQTADLTYASSEASGVTLDLYIAKDYAISILRDMITVLNWQIRIDSDDNVYFEPKSFIDNGAVLTNGSSFQVVQWIEDKEQMFNQVKIVGGFENRFTTGEVQTGVGTEFTLDNKPSGTLRVVVAAAEVSPDDYVVNSEDATVTFDSSVTNPTFDYSYDVPIVVINQDDSSVNTYGNIFKEVQAPWLNSFPDARIYSQKLLDIYSSPLVSCNGYIPYIDFDTFSTNEIVRIVDDLRTRDERLLLYKIKIDGNGKTNLYFGSREYEIYDWNAGINKRVKDLEKRSINETTQTFVRLIKMIMNNELTVTQTWKQSSPVDSFISGHKTLGRSRPDLNFEADCSDNSHNGTWNGSGIDGSQYTTSGYRLSAGNFNGSDNYISVADTVSGVQTLSFYIKTSTASQSILQLTASANVTLDSGLDIVTSGLTSATVYINGVAGTTVPSATWTLVTITFNSLSCDDIELGLEGSNYYTGDMDEVMLFDNKITTANMATIIAKDFYNLTNTFTIAGLLGYWSMDNPSSGDRSTSPVVIT